MVRKQECEKGKWQQLRRYCLESNNRQIRNMKLRENIHRVSQTSTTRRSNFSFSFKSRFCCSKQEVKFQKPTHAQHRKSTANNKKQHISSGKICTSTAEKLSSSQLQVQVQIHVHFTSHKVIVLPSFVTFRQQNY